MNQEDIGAQFAAQQHLNTVTTQAAIIRGQRLEIDSLNAECERLRQQVTALEGRLQHPTALLSRSTGMRCTICCAKAGEPHLPSCPNRAESGSVFE